MLLRIGVTVLRILLVLTFIINTSTAQNSGGQAAIPNTAPGRLLKQWLDAFNSGDVARYTKFEAEHVSEGFAQNAACGCGEARNAVSGDDWRRL